MKIKKIGMSCLTLGLAIMMMGCGGIREKNANSTSIEKDFYGNDIEDIELTLADGGYTYKEVLSFPDEFDAAYNVFIKKDEQTYVLVDWKGVVFESTDQCETWKRGEDLDFSFPYPDWNYSCMTMDYNKYTGEILIAIEKGNGEDTHFEDDDVLGTVGIFTLDGKRDIWKPMTEKEFAAINYMYGYFDNTGRFILGSGYIGDGSLKGYDYKKKQVYTIWEDTFFDDAELYGSYNGKYVAEKDWKLYILDENTKEIKQDDVLTDYMTGRAYSEFSLSRLINDHTMIISDDNMLYHYNIGDDGFEVIKNEYGDPLCGYTPDYFIDENQYLSVTAGGVVKYTYQKFENKVESEFKSDENDTDIVFDVVSGDQNDAKASKAEYEKYVTEITIESGHGDKISYSYQVPQFKDDTEDAKRLNELFADEVKAIVKECQENGNKKLPDFSYDVYILGDKVFVKLNIAYNEDLMERLTYAYDFKTGNEIDNNDIFGMIGTGVAEIQDALTKCIKNELAGADKTYDALSYEKQIELDRVTEKIIQPNWQNMYLDGNGALHIFVNMFKDYSAEATVELDRVVEVVATNIEVDKTYVIGNESSNINVDASDDKAKANEADYKNYVTEAFSEEGVYSYYWEFIYSRKKVAEPIEYSFSVPQFKADTEVAKKLNKKIMEDIMPVIENIKIAMKNNMYVDRSKIYYDVDLQGQKVTINVFITSIGDAPSQTTYVYDFETGMSDNATDNHSNITIREQFPDIIYNRYDAKYVKAYEPILRKACEIFSNEDEMPSWGGELSISYPFTGGTEHIFKSIGFTIQDFSGDGIPELYIGEVDEPGNADELVASDWLDCLYTLKDGKPVMVTYGSFRTLYDYLGGNQFYYHGTGGAAYNDFGLYSLSQDGTEMICEEFYLHDGDDVFYNTTGNEKDRSNPVENSELDKFIEKYDHPVDVKMTLFSNLVEFQ